jgi:hypothetical protein
VADFDKGDQVVDRRTGDVGVVLKVERAGSSVMYRVQFARASKYVPADQLEPVSFDPVDKLGLTRFCRHGTAMRQRG